MHPNSSGIERVHEKKKNDLHSSPTSEGKNSPEWRDFWTDKKTDDCFWYYVYLVFVYPPKTNKRREKVEMAIQSKEHAKKRLPAKADRAVWEKVTKRRAGRWDSVVEKVWKDLGGNQEEILPIDKVWEV